MSILVPSLSYAYPAPTQVTIACHDQVRVQSNDVSVSMTLQGPEIIRSHSSAKRQWTLVRAGPVPVLQLNLAVTSSHEQVSSSSAATPGWRVIGWGGQLCSDAF